MPWKHRQQEDTGTKADETVPVPVAVATSRVEAELIVGMLRSNGLKAAVAPDPFRGPVAGASAPGCPGIRGRR